MNGAAFPSPTAEMAEMNRIHYELEYTEGISQRMRIPEMLKMGPYGHDNPEAGSHDLHNVMMQVPERIVMSGDSEDSLFPRPRDLDLIQSTPLESLSLKTPPRVLTLNEQPLDFMEMERSATSTQPSEEVRSQGRLRRERSASENTTVRHNSQIARNDSTVTTSPPAPLRACPPLAEDEQNLYSASGVLSFIQSTTRRAYQQVLEVLDENHRSKPSLRGGSASTSNPVHESRLALATLDTTLDVSMAPDDMAVVDAATLRRQIIKLNRRLQLIEEENKERAKREMIMYSVTVAFWLINSWVWFRR
ncbi:mitochondrial fission factor isoform X1 [Coregonus clupeaformis]|uniref:mitochondrial fission factor isoform X1 n=1 Tax=Coregonus clupeaformis TaxID=59861 RepID=UPI001E1C4937|nr:mitochondrial fission factor isoform X1 [Coregonus clupeaformis]XP_045071744.1 mitochondrial fission factor isoform X1 [Coregonus clupeaformis]